MPLKSNILLDRDTFRESVFERDNHSCVNCGKPAQDAHHILERRLFEDGGYYLDNGASVCGECHILAEQTVLTAQELREKIGIEEPILPEHFYRDIEYDKWGNPYTNNFGNRLKGELFYDESVQKILKAGDQLQFFSKYVKYPRTFFVPWGEKVTKDDKVLRDDKNFIGQEVVVTIKMDGENTTMYNDFIHARSINSGNHPTRNKVKELWAQEICWNLSEDERICGENLYAKHSIHYTDLPSYFMVFSWWENNICLSWEETKFNCEVLGLSIVPEMYRGIYSPRIIQETYERDWKGKDCEGYVIRLASSFTYGGFRNSVMKYVDPIFRENLNEAHGHWISKKITPNKVS